jgi:hypothetical protein
MNSVHRLANPGFADPLNQKRLEGELQQVFVDLHDTLMDARDDFMRLEEVVGRVLYGENAAAGSISGLEV